MVLAGAQGAAKEATGAAKEAQAPCRAATCPTARGVTSVAASTLHPHHPARAAREMVSGAQDWVGAPPLASGASMIGARVTATAASQKPARATLATTWAKACLQTWCRCLRPRASARPTSPVLGSLWGSPLANLSFLNPCTNRWGRP